MQAIALVFMGFGVLAMALHAVTVRWVLRDKLPDGSKVAPVLSNKEQLVVQFAVSCLFLILAFYLWPEVGSVWRNERLFWRGLALTTSVGVLIHLAKSKSRGLAEVSLTEPYQAMTPGLIAMAVVFLHETPSFQGWVGIGFLVVGVWV